MARRAVLTFRNDPLVRKFLDVYLPRSMTHSVLARFGSRVRGDAMIERDLDALVVSDAFEGVVWPERMVRVARYAGFQDAVEVLCSTPAELETKRGEIGIVQAAVEEGRRVYPAGRARRGHGSTKEGGGS